MMLWKLQTDCTGVRLVTDGVGDLLCMDYDYPSPTFATLETANNCY